MLIYKRISKLKKNGWDFLKATESFERQNGLCADCGKTFFLKSGYLVNNWLPEDGVKIENKAVCNDCGIRNDNTIPTLYNIMNSWERTYKFKGEKFADRKQVSENAKILFEEAKEVFEKEQKKKCYWCQRDLDFLKAYWIKPFGFSSKNKVRLVCVSCNSKQNNLDESRDYRLIKWYKEIENEKIKRQIVNKFIEAYAFTILKAQKEFTWQLKKNNLPYDEDDLMDFQLLVREKYFKQAIEYCAKHLDEHEKNKKVYTIEFALFPNARSRGGYLRNLIKHLVDKKFNEVFPDKKRKKKGEKTTASERRKSVLSIDGFENFDLSDSRTLTPEQIYERKETWEIFQKALDNFRNCLRDDTERMIFDYYRNLNEKPKSERKIGEELGIERNKFNRTTKKMKLFVKDFERNYRA